jgi:hypothetical protein
MKVKFREFDPVNLWVRPRSLTAPPSTAAKPRCGSHRLAAPAQIWLELYEYPLENERKLLEEVIDAWYTLGHLGGFNTLNLQVLPSPAPPHPLTHSSFRARTCTCLRVQHAAALSSHTPHVFSGSTVG